MNNIISNFNQVVDFAEGYGLPRSKKRGILREYLQSKLISLLYSFPKSQKLSFIGGTSLRLLRDIGRFSEDLDFDNLGLSAYEVKDLLEQVLKKFSQESIDFEFIPTIKDGKTYFQIRFPNLLKELNISTDPREKLMIKVDLTKNWESQNKEWLLFNRYGFLQTVLTNSKDNLMVQKLAAYVYRKQTQARDIYDIVWLYSQSARVDTTFARSNNMKDVLSKAKEKYKKEGVPKSFYNKLAPFLIDEGEVKKLGLFGQVIESL